MSTVSVSALDRLGRRFGYDERSAAVLIFPVFIVLLAVAIFPIVYSFYTSLFDINLTRPWRRPFVGFDNYLRIFADPNFWVAVQTDHRLHGRDGVGYDRARCCGRAASQ